MERGKGMNITLQEVGKRLYERRKQLRMTQEELAERVGITAQTISTAELGKKAMRADTIIRVCGALDISADYLLFGYVSTQDLSILSQKVSQLTPEQYRHLEDAIDSFVAIAMEKKNEA